MGALMAVHPGPYPPGFDHDPATARALLAAAQRLAEVCDDLARSGRTGRDVVEARPLAGRTADEVRDRHDQLDGDLALLATAALDQVDELRREIQLGAEREAAAAAAQQRWWRALRAWQDAS